VRDFGSSLYLFYNLAIHRVMWFCGAVFDIQLQFGVGCQESISKIYVGILVEVPVLTRDENKGVLAV